MTRGEGERDNSGEKGEGTSQRTRMNGLWAWTAVWGLTVWEWGPGMGRGRQRGKIGTTVIELKF